MVSKNGNKNFKLYVKKWNLHDKQWQVILTYYSDTITLTNFLTTQPAIRMCSCKKYPLICNTRRLYASIGESLRLALHLCIRARGARMKAKEKYLSNWRLFWLRECIQPHIDLIYLYIILDACLFVCVICICSFAFVFLKIHALITLVRWSLFVVVNEAMRLVIYKLTHWTIWNVHCVLCTV